MRIKNTIFDKNVQVKKDTGVFYVKCVMCYSRNSLTIYYG